MDSGLVHQLEGASVREVLDNLFREEPALRNHLIDETGASRPHVLIFVNGSQASLDTRVASDSDIRLLQAVSGGQGGPRLRRGRS